MKNDQIDSLESRVKILTFITIVLFFLLMVVLFALLFAISGSEKSSTQDSITDKPVDKLAIRQLSENEIANLNKEATDICLGAPEEEKARCQAGYLMEKAASSTDLSLCELMSDESTKIMCRDNTLVRIADRDQSVEACQKLSQPDQQIACANEKYYFKALDNPAEGKEYCRKIINDTFQKMCLDEINKK
jgi:hypothetical protein